MQSLVKSPLNYIGNKYRQIPQLLSIFPKNINNFIDLFTGGGDIAANITANSIYANDINTSVIDILQEFQKYSLEELLNYIDNRINEFKLDKINEEGYLKYRELYNTKNSGYNSPLDLFTLTRFSYNQIIRFNNKMEFNAAFGKNRSSFNNNMRNNTIAFHPKIQDIQFSSMDFRLFDLFNFNQQDFLYIDPPYLIANADYNAGRTANLKWKEHDEIALYNYLDQANTLHIRWAMSNFLRHKNKTNPILENWLNINNYNIYKINSNYINLTTKADRINDPTIEVVITNY